MEMVTLRQDFVEMSCLGGDNIFDAVGKAFEGFYTGDGKNTVKATLRHLNGVKVTFEREPDSRIGNGSTAAGDERKW